MEHHAQSVNGAVKARHITKTYYESKFSFPFAHEQTSHSELARGRLKVLSDAVQ